MDDAWRAQCSSKDFHKIFGLNGSDFTRIANVDLAGVSLAAIKALKIDLDKKDKQIKELIDLVKSIKNSRYNK